RPGGPLAIETTLDPEELAARLAEWQPWSHRIDFSNGVSTADPRYERRRLFGEAPLPKLSIFDPHVPLLELEPGLRVGCNTGYNAIGLALQGASCTGVDYDARSLGAARFLAETAGVDVDFREGDGETFRVEEPVDLVVHLGTLYHLPNPIRALR